MLITPETHPDHPVVGQLWRGWDGHDYYCDSLTREGYWMEPVNASSTASAPAHGRSVSESVIGKTFHKVPRDQPYPNTLAVGS